MAPRYDALLLVSFGAPERAEDVMPFLHNVLDGTGIPEQRLKEVAAHYDRFGGVSPLGSQLRALLAAVVAELNAAGFGLRVYWGNRNWHPMLGDTLAQMAEDGVTRALAFVTSAFGSYSGCRRYLEDIERARQDVGENAPQVDKLRLFYNHPGFIEPMAERVVAALGELPPDRRDAAHVVYTAHAIPAAMAEQCPYQSQFEEACRLVSERAGLSAWHLAYQSRSGPPSQPWTGPDVRDCLRHLASEEQVRDVVVAPIGFLLENMEIVYDLDTEVADVAEELGLGMIRSAVVGSHPRFVRMIRELVGEQMAENPDRPALGTHGPSPDVCPDGCCPKV